MRYAVYFTPAHDHPLTLAAAEWLGRDAFSGVALAQTPVEGFEAANLAELTADPRRYGFHATLKAPFALKEGLSEADLLETFDQVCDRHSAFEIPRVTISRIGPFFALVPSEPSETLQAFAADMVKAFEPFRAPLSEADIARRKPERLSDAQREHLLTWGYPYVFEEFRFHMTLTGPVPEEQAPAMAEALHHHFNAFEGPPLSIDGLALFTETERGAPFIVHSRQPLAAPTSG